MLVTIVAVPNTDNTGLDPDRVEKVEDLHPDVARPMLDLGTARLPSDNELAAYHQAQDAPKHDNGGSLPAGETQVRNNTDEAEAVSAPARDRSTARAPKTAAPAAEPGTPPGGESAA